ncbi:MAG: dinitrogenase iron-molybdenum cofactor biosynthesis protein [Thiotrichaceae bacterium]
MEEQPISRDVALRIGLAARSLPDTDVRRLMAVLIDCVGLPLTEKKFAELKVKDLKTAAEGELESLSQEDLKTALRHLKGEESLSADANLPEIQPFNQDDMPNSIRVACASNTGNLIDGHFGSCARFLIYQVSSAETRLIDIRSTISNEEGDEKNVFRSGLISDCHVLYVASMGGPAAAKVIKAGIHPIKLPEGGNASDVIKQLQEVVANAPPPWLAKVMGVSPETRKRFLSEIEE